MKIFCYKFFFKKGGIWKVHMVSKGGVSQKSLLGPQGGQKVLKIGPHDLWVIGRSTSCHQFKLHTFVKVWVTFIKICTPVNIFVYVNSVQVKKYIFLFYFTQTLPLILVLLNHILANYNRLLQSCWYEPLFSLIFIMQ